MKKYPNSFLILIALILVSCALTWLIPAGSYAREAGESGDSASVGQFSYGEPTPVSPLALPGYIVDGFAKNMDLILVLLFSGGAFSLVNASGALQALIHCIAAKCQKRRLLLLILLTSAFALICSNQALQLFIPFVPVLVLLTVSMGYDSITGAALLILGGGVGFSTGTLRTTTTLIAQKIAGLPLYSGLWFRALCLVIFLVPTCLFLCLYARKIERCPKISPMYDLDRQLYSDTDRIGKRLSSHADPSGQVLSCILTKKHKRVLAILIVALALMVYGTLRFSWSVRQLAAVFLVLGIGVGILERLPSDEISGLFLKGSSSLLSAAFLVGFGTSISLILSAGGITDTIIHALSQTLSLAPRWSQGACMYLANTLVNVFITSGTAQASVVMPIFIPVADHLEMTRQTAVLAYNFGDGFSNYILPTSSALMGILGAAKIPFGRWVKFMGKMFLIWAALSCLLVTIAQAIRLGPC